MKLIIVLLIILIVMISVWAAPVSRYFKSILEWKNLERKTIELLRREDAQFLVTDKVITAVIVETMEENLLLGKREVFLIAMVKIYIGIDFYEIGEESIEKDLGKVVIRVPEPKILDFSVDFERSRVLSKRSCILVIVDLIRGRDLGTNLYSALRMKAMQQMEEYGLIPARQELVIRLNNYSELIESKLGVTVEFI